MPISKKAKFNVSTVGPSSERNLKILFYYITVRFRPPMEWTIQLDAVPEPNFPKFTRCVKFSCMALNVKKGARKKGSTT